MWTQVKTALLGLFSSKKFLTFVVGIVAGFLVTKLGLEPEAANQAVIGVFSVFLVLLGAQGMTDWGKGDQPLPTSIGDALKGAFSGLLGSKKFQAAIVTAVSFVLIKYLKLDGGFADQLAKGVLGLGMTLLLGQGAADFGKVAAMTQIPEAPPAQPVVVNNTTVAAPQA